MWFLRILVIGIGLWLIALLWRRLYPPTPPDNPKIKDANMVKCPICDVHIPKHEAIAFIDETNQTELYFCSEAHRTEYQQQS